MLRVRKTWGIVGGCLLWATCGMAQSTPQAAPLDALAQSLVEKHKLPGIVVAILEDGKISAISAAGVRKSGDPTAFTVDDRVHLGSCTKAMTATLMAILVEEGVLRWDSKLEEVFPEWRGKIHEAYLQVDLSQLLDHRGGFPANAKNWWAQGEDPISTREKILIESLQAAPIAPPGTKFEYSNLGYVAAGHMAEKLSGKSWEDLIREKMFVPLGMSTAGFGPPNTRDQIDQPWGHHPRGRPGREGDGLQAVQTDNAPALGPAGTVHCSVEDWARFLHWHLQPDLHPQLASAANIERLHVFQPADAGQERSYSGGWIVVEKNPWNTMILTHSGSNTAWMATVQLVPAQRIGFVTVTNFGAPAARAANQDAIRGLIDIYRQDHDAPESSDR